MVRKTASPSRFGTLILLYVILIFGSQARKIRSHPDEHVRARDFQPKFSERIANLTIAVGRDVTFRCMVSHLRGYRVGWVKADTKAIQAIHEHVVTHNPRISISHSGNSVWSLHIKHVQEEDAGQYMCQINTDPMISQIGILDVVVPPDFIDAQTSGDVMVPEGGNVKLTCKATGVPAPRITWRREDGRELVVREPSGIKGLAPTFQGEMLRLIKITRTEMGAYMCIASNGVPPTISKRILINVNFHPVIHVPNQLVGAPLGTDVTLECYVEASPKAITYWVRDGGRTCNGPNCVPGEMLIPSNRFETQFYTKSIFETKMLLIFRSLGREDCGSYRCVAKNSLGEVEGQIRLYEIPGPTRLYSVPQDEEDYNEQLGSAEREQDEELSNSVDRFPMQLTTGSPRGIPNRKANTTPTSMAPPPHWWPSGFILVVLLFFFPTLFVFTI